MKNSSEIFKKLSDMVRDIKVAMFTTQDADGTIRSRPMMVQGIEKDGSVWFFTSKNSGIVHTLQANSQVNLAYSSPEASQYVSLSGSAEVVDDQRRKKEMWSAEYNAWFPKGVNDPELTMLRVQIEAAEYWDSKTSRLVTLMAAAKAAITGNRPNYDEDAHGKIELH